jgi:hypothetical protein
VEWNAEPRKRRRGEARGSSVEGGEEKRSLILRAVREEILASGCKEEMARGEKSKMESVVTNAEGYLPTPRAVIDSVRASAVAREPPVPPPVPLPIEEP